MSNSSTGWRNKARPQVFCIGDKVTQIRNNYDKGVAGVFNGTVGVITTLSAAEQSLTVRTDEEEQVDYDFDELDELAYAYAMTIHRSQSSEYPAVFIPITTSAWIMLQRNPALHRHHQGQETRRAGRLLPGLGCRRPHDRRWPAATPPSPTDSARK